VPTPAPTLTVVVMGPAGAGKTTVAQQLHARTGWPWLDADDLHPPENLRLLAAGVPLDDAHRQPWLHAVADWIGDREVAGQDAVVACSALRRRYRDLLRDGHPSVRFVELAVAPDQLVRRVAGRPDHVMPASQVPDQVATLESLAPDEPGVRLPVAPDWSAGDTAARAAALLGL
jgi:gluconokinase